MQRVERRGDSHRGCGDPGTRGMRGSCGRGLSMPQWLCNVQRSFVALTVVVVGAPWLTCGARAEAPRDISDTPVFECRWTELPVIIDGKADDAAWSKAQPLNEF